jgi:hypothetical protein
MYADAEFQISFSIFFAPDCDSFLRVGLLSFKIFQNSFEKFCPSVPWDLPMRHLLVVLVFLDFRAEPRCWWKIKPGYLASDVSRENDSGSILRPPDRF